MLCLLVITLEVQTMDREFCVELEKMLENKLASELNLPTKKRQCIEDMLLTLRNRLRGNEEIDYRTGYVLLALSVEGRLFED